MSEAVKVENRDGILVLLIDNPPVNALSVSVRKGLHDALDKAKTDDSVKAIVLACAGRSFISGADIREFGKPPQPPGLHEVLDMLENSPRPVVAAIHGNALGGGLETALCCHFRIATKDTKLGLPEVKLGLLPGAGGTQRLPRVVGPAKAVQMIVTGEPINGDEGLKVGLVDGLFDPADAAALVATFPRDHFATIESYGGEKDYSYEARSLVPMGADTALPQEALSPAWCVKAACFLPHGRP